jgi:hypothetical protein
MRLHGYTPKEKPMSQHMKVERIILEPSRENQGMDCGCRVYFDGWYKVAYCPTHAAAPDLLAFVKRFLSSTDYDRDESEARALLAQIGKE